MQTYFEGEQASLFAPDTFAGRMSQAASAQARRTGRISGLSWRKLLDYIAPDYQFLDLSSDAGNLLGQYEWTTRSALHGGCWLRNMRTMAIQLPEELFERLKAYLKRNNLKQKQFIIGLIEDALEQEEEDTAEQPETEESDEPDMDAEEE